MKIDASVAPTRPHHCDACRYLGHAHLQDWRGDVDVYWCEDSGLDGSVLMRWGSRVDQYTSVESYGLEKSTFDSPSQHLAKLALSLIKEA